MNILHIQRTSAYEKNDFVQCIQSIKPDDALVFIDDGCYNLNHSLFTHLKKQHPTLAVFHLHTHAKARFIEFDKNLSKPISITQLIALTFRYDSTITWQ